MSDEARVWIRYAQDNLHVAELCLDHGLFNPSVQNAQQAVEKSLKAMSVAAEIPIEKTHNVSRLVWILAEKGTKVPRSANSWIPSIFRRSTLWFQYCRTSNRIIDWPGSVWIWHARSCSWLKLPYRDTD
jgi:hypothetical protein